MYSIVCAGISGMIFSMVLHKGKMNIEQILNATLAGGVMIGSASDMLVSPFISLIIGFTAGIISTLGFNYVEGLVSKYLKIDDVCGIAYLHMIPGFLGGIIACLVAGVTPEEKYGSDI